MNSRLTERKKKKKKNTSLLPILFSIHHFVVVFVWFFFFYKQIKVLSVAGVIFVLVLTRLLDFSHYKVAEDSS